MHRHRSPRRDGHGHVFKLAGPGVLAVTVSTEPEGTVSATADLALGRRPRQGPAAGTGAGDSMTWT